MIRPRIPLALWGRPHTSRVKVPVDPKCCPTAAVDQCWNSMLRPVEICRHDLAETGEWWICGRQETTWDSLELDRREKKSWRFEECWLRGPSPSKIKASNHQVWMRRIRLAPAKMHCQPRINKLWLWIWGCIPCFLPKNSDKYIYIYVCVCTINIGIPCTTLSVYTSLGLETSVFSSMSRLFHGQVGGRSQQRAIRPAFAFQGGAGWCLITLDLVLSEVWPWESHFCA